MLNYYHKGTTDITMNRKDMLRKLTDYTKKLSDEVSELSFELPVKTVYNPLDYAQKGHLEYIEKYGCSRKRVIFLGMNPGPWGMAQTGVPFGEVSYVKNWMKIGSMPERPDNEIPNRKIEGLDCTRSEVSGRRLWGLFEEKFRDADHFFENHFVGNYCPLIFMEDGGRNKTPDKLRREEREALFAHCDRYLREIIELMEPEYIVGIGGFAHKRAEVLFKKSGIKLTKILHPSPASPAANKDWKGTVEKQLSEAGVW